MPAWSPIRASVRLAAFSALALAAFAPAHAQAPTQIADRPGLSGADFASLSNRLMPAVVNISTKQTVSRGDGLPAYGPNSPLKEFNDLLGRGGGGGVRRMSSLGSGFIIDAAGFIATNNHVIDGADSIDVTLSDGTTIPAKLIGADADMDLALLKVESKTPLPFVPWANSDNVQVGEWVMAIGNPFGLGGTVTAGIVSARNRNIDQGAYDDFIQTDAAINKGNSGGPLFNLKGEVVGINTAIYSSGENGGSVGVGFSVPANLAKTVIGQLKQYGAAKRGTSGMKARDVMDQAVAESYGLSRPEGAIITKIDTGGPAQAAGLAIGDLITSFNNQKIKSSRDIALIIGVAQVGAKVNVAYIRKGQQKTATLTIAPNTSAAADKAKTEVPSAAKALSNIIGVKFRALDDTDRRRNRIPASVRGVVVDQVDTGSDAYGKLRPGLVVQEVNFQSVTSPDQAIAAAEQAAKDHKPVLLQVWGDGEVSFVSVRTKS